MIESVNKSCLVSFLVKRVDGCTDLKKNESKQKVACSPFSIVAWWIVNIAKLENMSRR